MSMKIYRSEGREAGPWVRIDLVPRRGPDAMRVWLMRALHIYQLSPIPTRQVPPQLRPTTTRWAATRGLTTDHRHVLIITDDQREEEPQRPTRPREQRSSAG
ncbi:hypothetical protein [Allobranchiibius huperziae]|uniref:Uncharacterized protein n=1 Tax=Allobranchiibius huperziae TaxID=1874116 RepID=A0A853DC80_9MICO|nr:hypothetical protein [Allobranchiibius huperziae]NYJ74942.1 hypothetical protein [Allobranchiibius huperziae]